MIVSRLAIALAGRFHADFGDEIARASSDERCIDVSELLSGNLSQDRILGAYLYRGSSQGWTLNVLATGVFYSETSLTDATVIFSRRSLPSTVMIGCSNRSIPITRIVEPSSTFDPFFLRGDVLVNSVTELSWFDSEARRMPALKLAVTF